MQNDFEQLTDPISTNVENPIQLSIEYKPGETEATWVDFATPEKLLAEQKLGFSYYDKDKKERVSIYGATFYIIRQYVRLGGKVWNANPTRTFESNLTHDMRNDKISFYERYVQNGLKKVGMKDDIKAWAKMQGLDDKATSFNIILVCYCPELNAVVEMKVVKRIEIAMQKAIKNASGGRNPGRAFIFDICKNIENRFLGFGFTGEYVKVKKPLQDQPDEGKEYDGRGTMLFEPVLTCGEISAARNPNRHGQLKHMADIVEEYVCAVKNRVAAYVERPQAEMQYPQQQQQAPPPLPQGAYQQPYQQPQYQNTPHIPPIPPPVNSQPKPFPVFNPAQIPPQPQQAPTWQNPPMDPNPTAAQITQSGDDLPF